jgi:hypothetical protein
MCNCALCPAHVHPINREGTWPFYLLSSCKPISQMSKYCGKRGRFAAPKDHSQSQQLQQWHSHFEPNLTEAFISIMRSCSLSNASLSGSCALRFFFNNGLIFLHAYPLLLFFRVSASAGCLARRPTPAIKHLHTRLPVIPSIFIFILII